MREFLIYGASYKSIFFALKLFRNGRKVHLILKRELIESGVNKFAHKFIPYSYFDEIDKIPLTNYSYLLLCDKPDNFAIVKDIIEKNPDIKIIDCLSIVTKGRYKKLGIPTIQVIKAFNNTINKNLSKTDIAIRKETYFCCDDKNLVPKIKNLGMEMGYVCLYAGKYENENLIISLLKLQEELKKQEFPDREINFNISSY